MTDAMATSSVAPYHGYGNIGGRFYMNLSMAASLAVAFGVNRKRFAKMTGEVFGRLPGGLEIPLVRLSRWRVLRTLLPVAIRVVRRVRANQKRLPHARYSALPPYPALIRGRFDPFSWAADPQRRSDLFDATRDSVPASDAITDCRHW